VALRKGFKSEANDIARQIRGELDLALIDPLDPWALAEYLAIPVLELGALSAAIPGAVRHFAEVKPAEFSAVTVFHGTSRLIVHNDSHARGRQASNLAHELSHGLVLHEPKPALDGSGCREWDANAEDEANWLAGALLISEEAALAIARSGASLVDAADRYGVSPKMVQFRVNVTGARRRVARTKKRA
jgi:Zn-dependent peptidase ImmA (M78 family)